MAQAAVELFTNNTYATVTTGGTTAPAGGTVESWTVNVTGAFPVASTSAGPPTLFHAADPAAPSEKFLVTVAPGGTGGAQSWTVTRGAEGTTPVAHSAGFVIVQATCAGILAYLTQGASASVYVNCDYTGGTDASAAFNAALANLPTVSGLQCGKIRFGPGKVKMASTPTNPGPAVYIEGAGNWATTIYSYVTGDCFRVYDSTTYSSRTQFGGGVKALTIDGTNAGNNSAGLHAGDLFQYEVGFTVQNFTGTGSIGAHFDNQYYWTEQLHGEIYASNCTSHVVFDVSGATTSTGSYARLNLKCYIDQDNPAFNGVVFQNGAAPYDGSLSIYGNFGGQSTAYGTTPAVLSLTGTVPVGHPGAGNYSTIRSCVLNTGVECASNTYNPYTIYMNNPGNNFGGCSGVLDFGAGGAFTSTNAPYAFVGFIGTIVGDSGLQPYLPAGSTNLPNGSQLINSTSAANISPLSANAGAYVTYILEAWIPYSSTSAAGTPTFGFTQPGITASLVNYYYQIAASPYITAPALLTNTLTLPAGPTLSTGADLALFIQGTVQFYASGTVQMTALTSNATDTFSVLAGAYLTLTPVSN